MLWHVRNAIVGTGSYTRQSNILANLRRSQASIHNKTQASECIKKVFSSSGWLTRLTIIQLSIILSCFTNTNLDLLKYICGQNAISHPRRHCSLAGSTFAAPSGSVHEVRTFETVKLVFTGAADAAYTLFVATDGNAIATCGTSLTNNNLIMTNLPRRQFSECFSHHFLRPCRC